jgi:[acyl-carrier-protein] S-malonyltransferase
MKTAFIFPGQGAQYVGMGKDFYHSFLVAKETFQEADELLQVNLSRLIFEGPETELTQTKNSQLAIFVTSVAILRTVEQQLPSLKPAIVSGLSLGEYTALYASGRLSFEDTLLLVQKRSFFMNEACEKTSGTMAAVLGLDSKAIEETVKGIVLVANYNAPGQIVISGTIEGIAKATVLLKEKGAKRVLPLNVHGAFHSPLMKYAEEQLKPYIDKAPILENGLPLVMNVPGALSSNIRANLIAQVTHPVRWEQGILAMKGLGVEQFIEIGCGKTLAGLNRKMEAPTVSIDQVNDLEIVYATA